MFKRFTDCDKWKDPWFRQLPIAYKLFWSFICDNCDNAGVWKVDMKTATHFIGRKVTETETLHHLAGRVVPLNTENWLVNKFVGFQFGTLSSDSPLHKAVLKLIQKHTLSLPYPYPSTRVQVKDKEKDKDKEDVKKLGVVGDFELIWKRYPNKDGRKAAKRYFKASIETQADWENIQKALTNYLRSEPVRNGFIKNGSTWFNNWQDWIDYTGDKNAFHGGTSISEQVAKRFREGGPETGRTQELSAGAVFARVRNLPTVQPEAGTISGDGNNENGNPLDPVRDDEAQ